MTRRNRIPLSIRLALFAFAFAVALSGLNFSSGAFSTNDIVRVEGGQISGSNAEGIRSYKGIPYAAPPIGGLRWKPPQPVMTWDGVRACTEYGPDCPQAPYPQASLFYSPPRPQSEDCLYLNVWTAARAGEKRPVMVWIHGGALTRGSGATRTYDGTAFAKKGVVLITINYRLGPFGYLAHSELTAESPQNSSGNYGVLDQIAALKWVQKNVAAFGGDPSRVTIFGESAGSWSVNVLVASPLAKGLFHRAIGQSGGSFGPMTYLKEDRKTLQSAEKVGAAFAKAVGADSIKALRAVPAEKIVDLFTNDAEARKFRTAPTVDGWVLPDEIRNIFAQGKQNDVPVIVGSNANEMTSLTVPTVVPKTMQNYRTRAENYYGQMVKEFEALYPVKSEADIAGAFLGSLRDEHFTLPMRTWARMTAAGKSKAYLYFFSHAPPNPNSKYLGAFHAGEIAYVFNNLNRQNPLIEDEDYKLADLMSSYWVNFATKGDPNGKGLIKWKPYDRDAEAYMEFGDTVEVRNHLLKEQLDFMERFQKQR
ncbi:MAG TPA: carboxylesterase/lipase family protein [Blastocatellia bacterium]|nr:carboxylesterase/lipase family protein [Blastocatellia bacterium]